MYVLPPNEGLEGLDAVLSELVIINVTKLHHQRNDLLQVLSWSQMVRGRIVTKRYDQKTQ